MELFAFLAGKKVLESYTTADLSLEHSTKTYFQVGPGRHNQQTKQVHTSGLYLQ